MLSPYHARITAATARHGRGSWEPGLVRQAGSIERYEARVITQTAKTGGNSWSSGGRRPTSLATRAGAGAKNAWGRFVLQREPWQARLLKDFWAYIALFGGISCENIARRNWRLMNLAA